MLLMITMSCFVQKLVFEKSVKLKNKLPTTLAKELKIDISALALIMF